MQRLAPPEHPLQQPQRAMLPLLLVRDALGLLARIFVRQLHELDVVAALRPIDAHLFAEILLQKLREQLRVLHLAWQEDLLRRAAARQIILLDQRRDRLLRRLRRRQDLIVLVQQVPVHKMQHGKAGLRLALIIADDVGVRHRPGRDKLLLAERLDGLQPVTQHRSLLKFQPLCRGLHPFADVRRHVLILPFQHQHHLLRSGPVFRRVARELAPGVAVPHVIVQAGPLLAEVAWEALAAPRQLHRQAQRVEHVLRHIPPAERAEIPCAVIRRFVGKLEHRIFLPQIDAHIGVSLAVFQQDVVFRHVPLDQ